MESGKQPKVSRIFLYAIMLGMLLAGTSNTLIMKLQDSTYSAGQLYTHPYLQTAFMFVGELFCFGLYHLKKLLPQKETKSEEQTQNQIERTNIHPVWLAIPAFLDFLASTCIFISLTMIDASVYQMLRGLLVVVVPLQSMLFLGRKQYRHHFLGIALIVTGVTWVSYVHVISSNHTKQESSMFGIVLLIISQFVQGLMFISEEKILSNYHLDPFKVVGTEGMWGCCIFITLLPLMQLYKCGGYNATGLALLCNYNYLENSAFAFHQFAQSKWLWVMSSVTIFDIAFFNYFGISITKYASAA